MDLGTGSGYVALEIARRHGDCRVLGVDIADEAIKSNAETARRLGLSNVTFEVGDGIRLDVRPASFDGIVSRYALHHFPDLPATLRDLRKALNPTGRLVVSDAIRNDGDDEDFINRFQILQQNGHVRMHTGEGLTGMLRGSGFAAVDSHQTKLSFSKALTPSYEGILRDTPRRIRDSYEVSVKDGRVHLCFDILNVALAKADG